MLSARMKPDDLPIYDDDRHRVQFGTPTDNQVNLFSPGKTLTSKYFALKAKYDRFLRNMTEFSEHVQTTTGQVKLTLIGAGAVAGVIVALGSPRGRLYKRMVPIGTSALVASACYPFQAWDVYSSVARNSYAVMKVTFAGVGAVTSTSFHATVGVWGKCRDTYRAVADNQRRISTSKMVQLNGVAADSASENAQEDQISTSEEHLHTVDLKDHKVEMKTNPKDPRTVVIHITASKLLEKSAPVPVDFGQSTAADEDMYTTR